MIRLSILFVSAVTIFVMLNAIGTGQCFGEGSPPKKHLLKEDSSPEGKIIVRHYVDSEDSSHSGDIWLYSAKDPSQKALLFSYERDADVLFSPDEKWLVINYRVRADESDALLFKRVNGLKYKETTFLNPLAWRFFKNKHKQYTLPAFNNNYVEAVQWSSDSKSLMVQVYGHDNNSPAASEPWYCLYDLTTGKMTLDFNRVFNRDTFHPNGRTKGR
ncbi:MAG: hypothetical protein L7F77_07605 [Candidatus Magnetominusculus sp. LBB02]|nr:hypothetical protein [Candidatus Magnetominusculus sp. LBB02]